MLGPHQQLDSLQPPLLGEQRLHVGLAVHHRHQARARQLARYLRAVAQPAHPAESLALLQRPPALRLPVRRVVLDVQQPQRDALRADRQRRVHVQPQRALRALVLADVAQPRTAGMLGKVELGAVLHAQHRALGLQAPQRALAVRRQDVLRGHRRVVRLVDQAVVALDGGPLALRGGWDRGHGSGGLHLRGLHQPLRQA